MGSTVNMFPRPQEPSGNLRGPSGGTQGAEREKYLYNQWCNHEIKKANRRLYHIWISTLPFIERRRRGRRRGMTMRMRMTNRVNRENLKRLMVCDGICGESANGLKNGCRRGSVWVCQAGRSKNCCRHFKLILCCFWDFISPHTKFHQNPMKNAVVVLVGWTGR